MRLKYLLPVTVSVLLLVAAAVIGLFAGPLAAGIKQLLSAVFPSVPGTVVQLLLVGTLTIAGLVYVRQRQADRLQPLTGNKTSPERPKNAPRLIGEQFDTEMRDAVRDIQLKRVAYSDTVPWETLRETVKAALRLSRGCTDEEAARLVDEGVWTDDAIAEAFLSKTAEYPVQYQLLRWTQPGTAYEMAVERTAAAADRFTRTELAWETAPSDETTVPEHETGWLGRTLAAFLQDGDPDRDSDGDTETGIDPPTEPAPDPRQQEAEG